MENDLVLANKLVGKIPEDWSYIHFKDIYGKPIRDFGSFSTTKLITFLDDGIPFLKSEMINEGSIDWTNTYYISPEVHKRLNKSYVEKDTILFSKIGSALGKAVVYNGEKGVCNSNAAIAKIVLNEKVADKYYYTYILNNSLAKRQFLRLIVSLLPRINLGDISDLILPLPPLIEQQKIAKILTTWDNAIRTTERLIENSRQQKKALMQQLLTGKKRLLDDDGKRFAGEWKEVTVSSFGEVVTGSTPPKNDTSNYNGNISWATAEDFKQKYVSNTKVKLTDLGATKARVVPKGSVLVTCIASIGKNAIANEDLATNQQINSVVINKSNSNEFFYYLIEFNTHKLLAWAGTTAVPILNKTSFEKVRFIVPDLKEQQKIAAVLSNADKEIELLEQQLADLQQEKRALMQQLLTGKRRVVVDGEVV